MFEGAQPRAVYYTCSGTELFLFFLFGSKIFNLYFFSVYIGTIRGPLCWNWAIRDSHVKNELNDVSQFLLCILKNLNSFASLAQQNETLSVFFWTIKLYIQYYDINFSWLRFLVRIYFDYCHSLWFLKPDKCSMSAMYSSLVSKSCPWYSIDMCILLMYIHSSDRNLNSWRLFIANISLCIRFPERTVV
jgi:hypothetical protein